MTGREWWSGALAFTVIVVVITLFAIMIADCIVGADGSWRSV